MGASTGDFGEWGHLQGLWRVGGMHLQVALESGGHLQVALESGGHLHAGGFGE